MIDGARLRITYVTSSAFKAEENRILVERGTLSDGTRIADAFTFQIRKVPIKEILEVDLRTMVQAEVTQAYSQIRVPCVVEHAGLIFEQYRTQSYPGGLTKPMWDTLGDAFVAETQSAGRRATACAVVAYCDGAQVETFVGETEGTLSEVPRGSRTFYWDTVFVPDDPSGRASGLTYAEIVEATNLGLEYKVLNLSQSTKAMRSFLERLKEVGPSPLWAVRP
jgi:XTP/dITP diphosphohydrolase